MLVKFYSSQFNDLRCIGLVFIFPIEILLTFEYSFENATLNVSILESEVILNE